MACTKYEEFIGKCVPFLIPAEWAPVVYLVLIFGFLGILFYTFFESL